MAKPKKSKKKKKKSPAYFPQAFLVWRSVFDKIDALQKSKLTNLDKGRVAKIQGSYIPEAVISKMFSNKRRLSTTLNKHLLNLENHKISSLVPELKLFRVDNNRAKPFYFPTTSNFNLNPDGNLNFEESYSANAAAIKSFSITLSGKNPYEASRKFLNASLTVKVDNISVLFKAPQGYANLADLFVIRTSGNTSATIDSSGKAQSSSDFQDSRNCRIGAILGYSVPKDGSFLQQEIKAIEGNKQLVNLFYSGHDISLEQDGSATISIKYTGFLEATNGSLANLISSPKQKTGLIKKISKTEKLSANIETFFSEEDDEEEKEEEVSISDSFRLTASDDFAQDDEEEEEEEEEDEETSHEDIIIAFKEIIDFLYRNNKIHSTSFKSGEKEFFQRKYKRKISSQDTSIQSVIASGQNTSLESLFSSLDASSDNLESIISQHKIHYFNFGDFLQAYFFKVSEDLLDVSKNLSDQLNKKDVTMGEDGANPTLEARTQAIIFLRQLELFNILTANFSGMRNESKKHSPSFIKNIADIPISLDTFYTHVYEEIGKPQFRFYGMYQFLSEFCIKLLNRSFDKFQGADLIRDLTFKLTTFSARDLKARIVEGSVNIDDIPSPGSEFTKSSIQNSSEYLVFHQESTQYNRSPGTGNSKNDTKEGIFHLKTSKNQGLLKTISFSKISMPQREAYLVARAGDIYDELRLPHNATAEMFGNNLFLPSSFVYIDPNSLGFGSIKDKNSAARRLGFGGYYTVESVTTEYSGGSMTTTLNLLFNAFPDTVGQPKLKTQNESNQLNSINKVTGILNKNK